MQFHACMLQAQASALIPAWHVRANGIGSRGFGPSDHVSTVIKGSPCRARMGIPDNKESAMNTQDERLDSQADRLAEEALHELGDVPLDDADDYGRQCYSPGCYPWLPDAIQAHPSAGTILTALRRLPAA